MATTEDVLSQEFHETAEGVTVLRRFSSTYSDYNTGSAIFRSIPYEFNHPFPYRIGDALNYDSLSFPVTTQKTATLRVTDIEVQPVDNENIKVEVFYSTAIPTVVQKMQPDTNASWVENLDIVSIETNTDEWFDDGSATGTTPVPFRDRFNTGNAQSWQTVWEEEGNDPEKIPANTIHQPHFTFTVTAYGSPLFAANILTFHLSVNDSITIVSNNRVFTLGWLEAYFGSTRTEGIANRNGFVLGSEPGRHSTDLASFDDTGRWLFTGCPIRRVRFDSWEYNFQFTYNARWPWNQPYGITIDKYPTADFRNLFIGMDNAPQEDNQQGIRG